MRDSATAIANPKDVRFGRLFTKWSSGSLRLSDGRLVLDSGRPNATFSLGRSDVTEVEPPGRSLAGNRSFIRITLRDGRRVTLFGMSWLFRFLIFFACLMGALVLRGRHASIWIELATIFIAVILAQIIEALFTHARLRGVAAGVQAWLDEGAPQRSA